MRVLTCVCVCVVSIFGVFLRRCPLFFFLMIGSLIGLDCTDYVTLGGHWVPRAVTTFQCCDYSMPLSTVKTEGSWRDGSALTALPEEQGLSTHATANNHL